MKFPRNFSAKDQSTDPPHSFKSMVQRPLEKVTVQKFVNKFLALMELRDSLLLPQM
jgi:hypothetical protein